MGMKNRIDTRTRSRTAAMALLFMDFEKLFIERVVVGRRRELDAGLLGSNRRRFIIKKNPVA